MPITLSIKIGENVCNIFQWILIVSLKIFCILLSDEEIGGEEGMRQFVHMNEFRNLNVAFALDEGMASAEEQFALFYAERCIWRE